MRLRKQLFGVALASLIANVHGQVVPPMDHVVINDPRLFDLSNVGPAYVLADGPITTGTLSVVQGPKGKLVGVANITNIYGNAFGPIDLKGTVEINGLNPLAMEMKGSAPGGVKVSITGTYDVAPKLMNVIVIVKIKTNTFQWNDSFVPSHANDTGMSLHRSTVASNKNGLIKGKFDVNVPATPTFQISVEDRQKIPTTDFNLTRTGSTIIGTFTNPDNLFAVVSAGVTFGYGRLITAGANVNITTDNLFLREL